VIEASVATYKSGTEGGAKQMRFGRMSILQTGKVASESTPLLAYIPALLQATSSDD
jgi:hypothetical protein